MWLCEFVVLFVGEWIRCWRHNTNPGYNLEGLSINIRLKNFTRNLEGLSINIKQKNFTRNLEGLSINIRLKKISESQKW
jgi:hypothetical protein